jgi:hypothetical protein
MRIRRDFTRIEGVKSARLVVIATEGRDTENIYFEAMKAELAAENVSVEVLHRDNNESSPDNVYKQIQGFMALYNIEQDDELWVVVDHDKWSDKMLSSVAQHCSQNANQKFCLSNPCFELWLLLHLEDIRTYSKEDLEKLAANKKVGKNGNPWLKVRMGKLLGHYKESNYDTSKLLPHVHEAISRAEMLDVNPADRWPQGIGTRVYLLAKSIMGNK